MTSRAGDGCVLLTGVKKLRVIEIVALGKDGEGKSREVKRQKEKGKRKRDAPYHGCDVIVQDLTQPVYQSCLGNFCLFTSSFCIAYCTAAS